MKHLVNFSQFVTEGIKLVGGKPSIDFEEDSAEDIVQLVNPPAAGSAGHTVQTVGKAIKMYHGYEMEDAPKEIKSELMDVLKKPDSISDEQLKKLIQNTWPTELKGRQVNVIIPAGSSSPLALRIANALKDLYYPKAKVIDVLKRFYADPLEIVNWEAYMKADEKTREQMDSFLRSHVIPYWRGPAAMEWAKRTGEPIRNWPGLEGVKSAGKSEYTGYIKKSSGLPSGSRRLLNPGHVIDDYIVLAFKAAESDYKSLISTTPKGRDYYNVLKTNTPYFMIVDDMMLGGTTLKSIVAELGQKLKEENLQDRIENVSTYSLFKYTKEKKLTPEEQAERSKKTKEKTALKKKSESEAYTKYLTLFKDAASFAKQLKKSIDQVLPQFVEKEIGRESMKPKENQIEISTEKVIDAAKKAGLY